MAFTKEQKQAYYANLRKQWKAAKDHADVDQIGAIIANHGLKISVSGFAFVSIQMAKLGLDGLPYLDAKTYKGWKDNGFQVKKGEKSQIVGLTWVHARKSAKDEDNDVDDDDGYMMPKVYKLFHRSQVQPA